MNVRLERAVESTPTNKKQNIPPRRIPSEGHASTTNVDFHCVNLAAAYHLLYLHFVSTFQKEIFISKGFHPQTRIDPSPF
jgi:hypothetical protein